MKHYSLHPLRGHGLHFKTHHSDTLRSNMAQRTDQTEWMNPTAFIWAIYSHPSLSVWSVGNRGDWLIYPSSSSSVGSGAREKARACSSDGDSTLGESTVKDHLTSIRVTARRGTLQFLMGVNQRLEMCTCA